MIRTEAALAQMALAVGAADVGGSLSSAERNLADAAIVLPRVPPVEAASVRAAIRAGEDPLGDAFSKLRDAATRRADGAVYTPVELVGPMLDWVVDQRPGLVIDGGSGSGRFIGEILRRRPEIEAVAVDSDPLATLMTRAVIACLRARSVRVIHGDYTRLQVPDYVGRTAFIGNPPYVRHHQLTPEAKSWAQETASRLGHRISGLAGLHAYFFLATAVLGRAGDVGCFVTSAEWLDVNYGAIMRSLVLNDLGGQSLHVVEPRALPFEGTQTTAVITTLALGSRASAIRLQDVESADQLKDLATTGRPVARERLQETPRWTGLLRTGPKPPQGFIELGGLCRVHRGTVTGANATWVVRHHSYLPLSVLYPSVTKARELFAAGAVLASHEHLRLVVDIPAELDRLDPAEREQVARFIKAAKKAGVDKGYIAAHRRAWWSVGLKAPAPILATYMARRPPAFVMNTAQARHINIAHGLYPRQSLDAHTLSRLAGALRAGVDLSGGRTYAGGLVKFEPKEMERLMVPDLATLRSHEPLSAVVDA
ncbi:MAG: Eco57I restriction-modification methylase domain-containing protein [Streptosporangiaceae bacterium]